MNTDVLFPNFMIPVPLGDFVTEGTAFLAGVPQDSPRSLQVRALHFLIKEEILPDPQNYWLLQVGRLTTGSLQLLVPETSFAGGLSTQSVLTVPYRPSLMLSSGDFLGARLSPRGDASPLVGLSCLVELATLTTTPAAGQA